MSRDRESISEMLALYNRTGLSFSMIGKLSSAIVYVTAVLILVPALRAEDNRFVVFDGGKHGYINQSGNWSYRST